MENEVEKNAGFVELHARSAFSFLEGATLPEALAARCAEMNMPAMALLDRDGFYGAPRFHLAMKKLGMRAHLGSEITVKTSSSSSSPNSYSSIPASSMPGRGVHYPLLVKTRAGYQNLCRLITQMKLRAKKGEGAAREDELQKFSGGLICLTGGAEGPLAAALISGGQAEGRRQLERLVGIFGRGQVYVELQRHRDRFEEARNQAAVELARSLKLPLLASNGVCHATRKEREVLDVFACIRNHVSLDGAGRLLASNSERQLKAPAEMQQLFADLPEALANTCELSSQLEFTLADLGYQFPRYPVAAGETMMSFLRARTGEGFGERYLSGQFRGAENRALAQRARQQVERELTLIEKLGLEGYFLIVWDIVRFCRQQGILAQGRGSAANSAVCYSLGITAVDPIRMELLFERFLSEERGEWPDIDLDLPSGDQRERVIQYVYERYGKLGAAMTANVITYRGRSAAREIGKALGFEPEILGRLSQFVGSWEYQDSSDTLERQFRETGLDLEHTRIRKFLELCLRVQDLPRHLGQHSGGMVICQGALDSVVPLEPASMPGRVVVQWDKEDCADMGLIKVDLLGLGMMAVLEDSLDLIRNHYGRQVDLAQLPQDDSQVYETLQNADTVGMFQVESRAQMACLPRLYPKCFYDIVIQVALIRPGPIVGQMVNPYIKRRQGREIVAYAHPSLEPILERTLGVPLFQEQLLRMAMVAANFTGGEAEELRRALGAKRSQARMREIEIKLRRGMDKNGIPKTAQEAIILSIVSFALYGFPESHAASFALIAYASAYLKCHYLAAFTAALLNNQPMGFYRPATIVKDAQRHGLRLRPVDVTRSEWLCTLENSSPTQPATSPNELTSSRASSLPSANSAAESSAESSIKSLIKPSIKSRAPELRLGMCQVRGLRQETAEALLEERRRTPFSSIDDLARRVPQLRHNDLVMLAQIGALNSLPAAKSLPANRSLHDSAKHDHAEPAHLALSHAQHSQSEHASTEQSSAGHDQAGHGQAGHGLAGHCQADLCQEKNGPTLNSQKLHRRDALWEVERAVRLPGPLLEGLEEEIEAMGEIKPQIFAKEEEEKVNLEEQFDASSINPFADDSSLRRPVRQTSRRTALLQNSYPLASPLEASPLEPMNNEERLVADFHGTGLTIGPHPMSYRRAAMNALGVYRASDLAHLPNGKHLRIAGCVIVRQRPGTAHGFIFLSLEDETGIANAIIEPRVYEKNRFTVTGEKFLLIEGELQNIDRVVSVKAHQVKRLEITAAETRSHDFH